MRYVKWFFRIVIFLAVALLLDYVLPRHDVARVSGTEVIRMDFSSFNRLFFAQTDSGNVEQPTRDVRLVNTVKKKTLLFGFIRRDAETVLVLRNEDTGWIWPPYFKFDSSDLQAEATGAISTAANPQWVVLTHYGWRNRFFTIYPNLIHVKPVEGPDVVVIPWFNIFFFIFLIIAYLFLRAVWRQFRERSIDPALTRAGDAYGRVDAHLDERRGRLTRWLDTWRSKPRK